MKVQKETPHLFLRLNDYENNNYITEHQKVIEKNGYTWMVKIGKTINREYLNEVIEKNGGLIVKSTKKNGNKFYFCKLISCDPGEEELVYPEYYNDYFYYEGYNIKDLKKNAYWFKIQTMDEMDYSEVEKYVVGKFKKKLITLALETRVVHMYTKNVEDIEL